MKEIKYDDFVPEELVPLRAKAYVLMVVDRSCVKLTESILKDDLGYSVYICKEKAIEQAKAISAKALSDSAGSVEILLLEVDGYFFAEPGKEDKSLENEMMIKILKSYRDYYKAVGENDLPSDSDIEYNITNDNDLDFDGDSPWNVLRMNHDLVDDDKSKTFVYGKYMMDALITSLDFWGFSGMLEDHEDILSHFPCLFHFGFSYGK